MKKNYMLNIVDGKVPYLMRAGKDMVSARANKETVEWLLAKGKIKKSTEFEGYPICVDDIWFISGEWEEEKQHKED